MHNPLISVIVPIYNVEKYLKQCIDSLINQEYKNLEIVLVDDGSPDSCGKICDDYASNDARIKVVHKINGGLSDARNVGFAHSTGSLVSFIDSDDFLDLDFYKQMASCLEENSCQVVECSTKGIYNDKIVVPADDGAKIVSGMQALSEYLKKRTLDSVPRTAVWTKLYKREIINDLSFPVGQIHEDYLFTATVFFRCQKYGILYKPLYNHRYNNPSSITNTTFSRKDLFREKQWFDVVKLVQENGSKEQYLWAAANYYRECVIDFYKTSYCGLETEAGYYRSILKNGLREVFGSKLEKKKKLEILFIVLLPQMYLFIRNKVQHARSKVK